MLFFFTAPGLSFKTTPTEYSVLCFTAASLLFHLSATVFLNASERLQEESFGAVYVQYICLVLLSCLWSTPPPSSLRYQCNRPYYSQQDASHTERNKQREKKKEEKDVDWSRLYEYFLNAAFLSCFKGYKNLTGWIKPQKVGPMDQFWEQFSGSFRNSIIKTNQFISQAHTGIAAGYQDESYK